MKTQNSSLDKQINLLPDLSIQTWQQVFATAQRVSLPAGTTIFSPGDQCKQFLVVLHGSVKVVQLSESGKEIVLYRVQDMESCLLTTTCLLSDDHYSASAVTETVVDALILPANAFMEGMSVSGDMRSFVFKNYNKRMAEFIVLVKELAFETLDARLSSRLLQQADNHGIVTMTHQELAMEIGSTREVVSRRLKEFEQQGWLRLHRGRIEIVSVSGLLARD